MHSCIYEGTVRHRRFREKQHSFRNRLFLMYLDLDELPTVFQHRWLWSATRTALARFRREHHLGDSSRPLKDCVQDLVEEELGRRPVGPVRLLTNLSYFGYVMNPVSFYFCYGPDDREPHAIVAEVTNTPWGERHCYVLDTTSAESPLIRSQHSKELHVSPFMPMNMVYHWKIRPPGQRLTIHVENQCESQRAFDATLTMRRQKITSFRLSRCLIRYPFMSGQIVGSIYWQAFRLWLKKVTFYCHPATPTMTKNANPTHPAEMSSGIPK